MSSNGMRSFSLTRRDALKAAGATMMVGGLAGCLGDDDDAYVIGMVDSRTGSLEPYGQRNERGKTLALQHINSVGIGDDDLPLEVDVQDSESMAGPGIDGAQVLVEERGVPILIGAVGSGVTSGIHDSVIDGTDTVQISQNSTGALFADYPNVLRTSPNGAEKGSHLADLIYEDGHEEVAITWVNNDYGVALEEVFQEEFQGTVVESVSHEQEESTYSGELTEMADADPSAMLFITYAEEFIVMANEGYDRGYHEEFTYYGAESTIADSILENTEPGSQDGMKGVTETAPVDDPNYQSFEAAFIDEFDMEPSVWAAYTYDAIMLAAIGIHVADEFTGSAIGEVIRDISREPGETVNNLEEAKEIVDPGGDPNDINYHGVSGPINWDDVGDPEGAYQIYHVEDHEYVWGDFLGV